MVDFREINTHAINHCQCEKCKQFRAEQELVFAERERCAKIADEVCEELISKIGPSGYGGRAALSIAERIRAGV